MRFRTIITPRATALLLGTIVFGLSADDAHAQFGMGFGWGFGMRNVPSPQDFLNQHALTRTAAGRPERSSFSPYSNSSGAYFNRIRDNGFVSHYDVSRRQPPAYQPAPARAVATPAPAEAPPAAAAPITPLASFFNAAKQLVWPSESPVSGDFKEKRDVADQASLAVLEELGRQPAASLSSVTHARQKLVDYGQPALQEIRAQATPVIADAFHRFLLALYDSLGSAAGPLAPPPVGAP
jgi:hypothetical protein